MKINLNAIGFTNKGWIIVGEKLLKSGVCLSIGGLTLVTLGVISVTKSQEWICASTDEQVKTFMEIHKLFD